MSKYEQLKHDLRERSEGGIALAFSGTILKTGCHAGDGRFFRTFQMELRSYAADFRFGNAELGKR